MESRNAAAVFQEAGVLTHGLTLDPNCMLNFIILYTSTFIRLVHFYQELCVGCDVIKNDKGME